MRILQIIPDCGVGGAERMMAHLARHLRQMGHSVSAASFFGPLGTSIEDELGAAAVPLHFFGKRRGVDSRMIPRLARLLEELKPDVIHTHRYALAYLLPALLRRSFPVVHTLHNMAEHEIALPGRLLQWLAFRAGVVPVAIGTAVADSIYDEYGLRPSYVIPNGIPVERYRAPPGARGEVRSALGIDPGAPTFVTVGRFMYQKNHRLLVDAFASGRLRRVGAHLILAGDGELRGELEGQIRTLGVADRVHLLGVRNDVERVLACADVFVLSSRWEGNPLTVMEAMAAGKPIISAGVGCVPELVAEGTGRLVPPEDGRALEAAMFELCADSALARTMGAEAQRVARARFDDDVMARAYADLYDDLVLGGKQRAAPRPGKRWPSQAARIASNGARAPSFQKLAASALETAMAAAASAVWSIGIYTGDSPLALAPAPGIVNPILGPQDVTDEDASFVADPFMIPVDGTWHMFFEVMVRRGRRKRGVIGHATSPDGLCWSYQGIVLEEPFHLSYPHVFQDGDDVYLIPECREAGAIRLYRGDPFPDRWVHVADLVRAPVLLDASIFRRDGRWWMFAETSPAMSDDTLALFHAPDLLGPWVEHPRSPVVTRNPHAARPGGRVLSLPDRLLRFAQGCSPAYGLDVKAFEVTRLSETEYEEREIEGNPLLAGTGSGWNRDGMHQIDAHPLPDGRWIACVDGHYRTLVRPREIALRLSSALRLWEHKERGRGGERERERRG
jgi:glycosyltransferase involved in cell wall biosynthesis